MKTKTTGFHPLTNSQWAFIRPILEPDTRRRKVDLRQVFNGLLYVLRTGCQWRLLPEEYPHWAACYYYFDKWMHSGRLEVASKALNILDRRRVGKAARASMLLIDAQSVGLDPTLYEHRGIDGGKRVNGQKRIIVTDTEGRLEACSVVEANRHDSPAAALTLTDHIEVLAPQKVIADKGFGGTFARAMTRIKVKFETTGSLSKEPGFVVAKWRWVVERTFAWMRWCRRLVHVHEHTASAHNAFLYLFNCSLMLNRLRNSVLIS